MNSSFKVLFCSDQSEKNNFSIWFSGNMFSQDSGIKVFSFAKWAESMKKKAKTAQGDRSRPGPGKKTFCKRICFWSLGLGKIFLLVVESLKKRASPKNCSFWLEHYRRAMCWEQKKKTKSYCDCADQKDKTQGVWFEVFSYFRVPFQYLCPPCKMPLSIVCFKDCKSFVCNCHEFLD